MSYARQGQVFDPLEGVSKTAMLVWNPATLTWERYQGGGGGGGGGGAVTIANGADVNAGATTDAAVTSDTTGTLSAKLRGLVKWAYERMPASLGQKTMAASLPVVLPSNQTVSVALAATQFTQGLALRYDEVDDTTAYRGEAAPGSSESASVWRIQRITFGADGDVTRQWADGDAEFDNQWSQRTTLSYS